jgi:hypothetical protein
MEGRTPQSKSNQKVLFKVGTFYNNQHKLSRAFQTDMKSQLDRAGIKIQLYKLHLFLFPYYSFLPVWAVMKTAEP